MERLIEEKTYLVGWKKNIWQLTQKIEISPLKNPVDWIFDVHSNRLLKNHFIARFRLLENNTKLRTYNILLRSANNYYSA